MGNEKPRNMLVISALMEKAEQDPMLRARLLTEPENVAAEHKVSFDAREVEYLKKAGELFRLVDELKAFPIGHGPIRYPIDVWRSRKIVSYARTLPPRYNPGYFIDLGRYLDFSRSEMFRAQAAIAKKQF